MGQAIVGSLAKHEMYHITTCQKHDDPNQKLSVVDVVIVAVKPQSFLQLADSISIDMSGKLVISIMAGVTIDKIKNSLSAFKVVRSIPNLAIRIGRGVTEWFPSQEVRVEDKLVVRHIFSAMGKEIEVAEEDILSGIGSVSGIGPAFFYYLTELLAEKAEEYGFSPAQARVIAEETFVGSALLLDSSERSSLEWREAVSSKGGITIEALKHLKENKFDQILKDAVDSAKNRSNQLLK